MDSGDKGGREQAVDADPRPVACTPPAAAESKSPPRVAIWAIHGAHADEFQLATEMPGRAGSIAAKIVGIGRTNGRAKAGVMVYESLQPDSAHAVAYVAPRYGGAMRYRPSTGGTGVNWSSGRCCRSTPGQIGAEHFSA